MSNNFNLSQAVNTPFNFRNKFINGDFRIWQRWSSVAVGASGIYTADRYVHYAGVGGAATVSKQTFTPGQTDVP